MKKNITLLLTLYKPKDNEIVYWKNAYNILKAEGIEIHWLIDNPEFDLSKLDQVDSNHIFKVEKNMGKFSIIYDHISKNNVKTDYFKSVDPDDNISIENLIKIDFPEELGILNFPYYILKDDIIFDSQEQIEDEKQFFPTMEKNTYSTANTVLPTKGFEGDFKIDFKNNYINIFEDQMLGTVCFGNGMKKIKMENPFYIYKNSIGLSNYKSIIANSSEEFCKVIDLWFESISALSEFPETITIFWYLENIQVLISKYESTEGKLEESIKNAFIKLWEKYEDQITEFKNSGEKIKLGSRESEDYVAFIREPIDDNSVFVDSLLSSKVNGELFYAVKWILENTQKKIYIGRKTVFNYDYKYFSNNDEYKDRVVFVNYCSKDYQFHLATSKYLLADAAFPMFFLKRVEQVYFNPWHGIPLKSLGTDIKVNDVYNGRRNFMLSDEIIVNSDFLGDVLFDKYLLEDKSKIKKDSYMRNHLVKSNDNKKTRVLFLYTWRAKDFTHASVENYRNQFIKLLEEADKLIDEKCININDYEFKVNVHHLILNVDLIHKLSQKLKYIKVVNGKSETTQMIMDSDIIVTDFSSVLFESIYFGKKLILDHTYYDEYDAERGIYHEVNEEIPVKKCIGMNEVVESIFVNEDISEESLKIFNDKYFQYDDNDNYSPWIKRLFEFDKLDELKYIGHTVIMPMNNVDQNAIEEVIGNDDYVLFIPEKHEALNDAATNIQAKYHNVRVIRMRYSPTSIKEFVNLDDFINDYENINLSLKSRLNDLILFEAYRSLNENGFNDVLVVSNKKSRLIDNIYKDISGYENVENNRVLTIGTFDSFHIGHFNIIKRIVDKYGQENTYIAIASDEWSKIKGKILINDEIQRTSRIKEIFPNVNVLIEKSTSPFGDIPNICYENNINSIVLGEDHKKYEQVISKMLLAKDGLDWSVDMKFLNRTPGISSSLIRGVFNEAKSLLGSNNEITKTVLPLVSSYEFASYNGNFGEWANENFISSKKVDINNMNPWSKQLDVWKIGNYIYKEFDSALGERNDVEFNILSLLGRECIKTNNGVIFRYIDGNTITKVEKSNSTLDKISVAIKEFRESISSYDNLPIFDIERLIPAFDVAEELLGIDLMTYEDLTSKLKSRLSQLSLIPLHTDLNQRNIIINEDENVYLIDFELSRKTIETYDLASFIVHSNLDKEQMEYFISKFDYEYEIVEETIKLLLFRESISNIKNGKEHDISDKIKYGLKLYSNLKKYYMK